MHNLVAALQTQKITQAEDLGPFFSQIERIQKDVIVRGKGLFLEDYHDAIDGIVSGEGSQHPIPPELGTFLNQLHAPIAYAKNTYLPSSSNQEHTTPAPSSSTMADQQDRPQSAPPSM